jgi:HEAT repeat protein
MQKIAIGVIGVLSGMLWLPGMAIARPKRELPCSPELRSQLSISLIRSLEDSDYKVRQSAIEQLRSEGRTACSSVPQLIKRLNDWHPQILASVADLLGTEALRWDAAQAIKPLRHLLNHSDAPVRSSAAYALGRIAQTLSEDSVTADLLRSLQDSDHRVKIGALRGLGALAVWEKQASQVTVQAVEALLQDDNVETRIVAIETLRLLMRQGGFVPSLKPDTESRLRTLFKTGSLPEKVAIVYFWQQGGFGETTQSNIPDLMPLLTDEQAEIQNAAEDGLSRIYLGEAWVRKGIMPLLKHPNSEIRSSALRILGSEFMGHDILPKEVIPFLQDPTSQVRAETLFTLARMGSLESEHFPMIRKLLQDSDAKVRSRTLRTLQVIEKAGYTFLPQTIGLLKDPSFEVRSQVLRTLLGFGVESSVLLPYVMDILKDSDPQVRRSGLNVLIGMSLSDHAVRALVPAMLPLTYDIDRAVRQDAIEGLNRLGYEITPSMQKN